MALTYKVKPGDTLSGIAKNNNTDINTMMKLNPQIKNPNVIYAGDTFNLPEAQPAAPAQPVAQPTTQPTAQPTQNAATNNGIAQYANAIGSQAANIMNPPKSVWEQANDYANGGIGDALKTMSNPYDAVIEKQRQALQGQRDLMESKINAQRDDVLQAYQNNARQAYINSMLGKQQVGQQLAQAGLNTSGLVGSAYANIENAYGNSLAGLQTTRDKSINDINRQLNEAQLQYDIEENKMLADIEQAKIEYEKYKDERSWERYMDKLGIYLNYSNMEHGWNMDDKNYNLNRDRFNLDKEQQALENHQWDIMYNYNEYWKNKEFENDEKWRQKEYDLASKKASSSSSSSRSSSRSSSSGSRTTGNNNIPDNKPQDTQEITIDDIMRNIQVVQGPTIDGRPGKNIYDKYSGKYFSSPNEVLEYWTKQGL